MKICQIFEHINEININLISTCSIYYYFRVWQSYTSTQAVVELTMLLKLPWNQEADPTSAFGVLERQACTTLPK